MAKKLFIILTLSPSRIPKKMDYKRLGVINFTDKANHLYQYTAYELYKAVLTPVVPYLLLCQSVRMIFTIKKIYAFGGD